MLTLSAPTALAADDEKTHDQDTLSTAAKKAFNQWHKSTITSDPTFSLPGATSSSTLDWVVPFTTDQTVVQGLVNSDKSLQEQLKNPKKLEDIDSKQDTMTLALAPDKSIVAVLPYDSATVNSDGTVTVKGVVGGDVVTVDDDDKSETTMPVAVQQDSIKLLYSADKGAHTSQHDLINAVSPQVTVSNESTSWDNGQDKYSIPFDGTYLPPIDPGSTAKISDKRRIVNNSDSPLTTTIEAYALTDDKDKDKKDGKEDGLTPIEDKDGNQVKAESTTDPGSHDSTTTIEFVVPDDKDGQVYLKTITRDKDGNIVSPTSISSLKNQKPMMDVQASTENKSSKLDKDKDQKIYNQVSLNQLTPGKRYQILVNLYQCTSGECTEVAAVNREIIPTTPQSTQNFSVDVNTKGMGDSSTFEWTTKLYEGTGDVYNMGPQLAAVDNHPDSQILSFDGKRRKSGTTDVKKSSEKTQMKPIDEYSAGNKGDDVDKKADSEDTSQPTIGNEEPPADMGEVRQNNKNERDEISEHRKGKVFGVFNSGFEALVAGLLGIAVCVFIIRLIVLQRKGEGQKIIDSDTDERLSSTRSVNKTKMSVNRDKMKNVFSRRSSRKSSRPRGKGRDKRNDNDAQ